MLFLTHNTVTPPLVNVGAICDSSCLIQPPPIFFNESERSFCPISKPRIFFIRRSGLYAPYVRRLVRTTPSEFLILTLSHFLLFRTRIGKLAVGKLHMILIPSRYVDEKIFSLLAHGSLSPIYYREMIGHFHFHRELLNLSSPPSGVHIPFLGMASRISEILISCSPARGTNE